MSTQTRAEPRPTNHALARIGGALAPGALALDAAAGALGVLAYILGVTDLWETPDTLCGQLLNPTDGFCHPIWLRRVHWVALTLVLGVVVLGLAIAAHRARRQRRRAPALAFALVLLALACVGWGAWQAAAGSNEFCGSTLSRVDPHGIYSPGQNRTCASSDSGDRMHAWLAGAAAAVLVAAACGMDARQRISGADATIES